MIISMFKILCVTNRQLCEGDFLSRIEAIAKCRPEGILLREKDLSEEEYRELAKQVIEICRKYQVKCIFHSYISVAMELKADAIHLPMYKLRTMTEEEKQQFPIFGASCHSVEEAIEAEKAGCSYIIAGHIFATDCKKGLAPRGVSFLEEVCKAVEIPVYAIGGIDATKLKILQQAGAQGACMMSGCMKCNSFNGCPR